MQPIDIRTVLETIKGLFADMLIDDSRKIDLDIAPGPSSAYRVRGNDGRLGQVFTNLIDNALSFSPEGGTVTVRMQPNGSKVAITIEDEGPGIPSDKLGQIFDRFYSDRPQTDNKRGKNSGLGLSISREIVCSHNGEIFAENRPQNGSASQKGAKFTVHLPLISETGAGLVRRS
jgi:two-component system sensor histidine kinase ChvG